MKQITVKSFAALAAAVAAEQNRADVEAAKALASTPKPSIGPAAVEPRKVLGS